jgi:predicted DNA-binding protein with PD1-like motif
MQGLLLLGFYLFRPGYMTEQDTHNTLNHPAVRTNTSRCHLSEELIDPMQYSEGKVGRVFTVRIDDGKDFLQEIQQFVTSMGIQCGTIQFLGAVRSARLVTGPKEPVIPPSPHREEILGGWELLGFATIYPGDEAPSIHLHTAAGRGMHSLTGCLRDRAEVYLVIEAIITEFTGITAKRILDEKTGVNLPLFDRTLQ